MRGKSPRFTRAVIVAFVACLLVQCLALVAQRITAPAHFHAGAGVDDGRALRTRDAGVGAQHAHDHDDSAHEHTHVARHSHSPARADVFVVEDGAPGADATGAIAHKPVPLDLDALMRVPARPPHSSAIGRTHAPIATVFRSHVSPPLERPPR